MFRFGSILMCRISPPQRSTSRSSRMTPVSSTNQRSVRHVSSSLFTRSSLICPGSRPVGIHMFTTEIISSSGGMSETASMASEVSFMIWIVFWNGGSSAAADEVKRIQARESTRNYLKKDMVHPSFFGHFQIALNIALGEAGVKQKKKRPTG